MALKRMASPKQATNSTVEYENLAEGEHEGRLVYVADLGMQKPVYKGEEQDERQQIALGIELVNSSVTIDGEEKPRLLWTTPINIYYSMTERGIETKMYQVFDPTAMVGEVADWDSVLGKPCNVITYHNTKDGRTYDNIKTILPIPAKYQDTVAPNRILDLSIGDSDDENNPAQKALFGIPRNAYTRRLNQAQSTENEKPKLEVVNAAADDDFEDDLPF
jgi:hypothetical protein